MNSFLTAILLFIVLYAVKNDKPFMAKKAVFLDLNFYFLIFIKDI